MLKGSLEGIDMCMKVWMYKTNTHHRTQRQSAFKNACHIETMNESRNSSRPKVSGLGSVFPNPSKTSKVTRQHEEGKPLLAVPACQDWLLTSNFYLPILDRPCASQEGASMLLRSEGGLFRREGGFLRRGGGLLRSLV